MSLISYLKDAFRKGPETPYKSWEKIILKLGYKKGNNDTFVKESSVGSTMIWLLESGVKIKVYVHDYGESDFLPASLADAATLKSFIRSNEL